MTINEIAQICHETNRALCLAFGDTSQKRWEDSPQWQIESAIDGVKLHLVNERSVEASHQAWMAHKVKMGWVQGEIKDETKRTHPCIVPFDQLPPEQQAKDYIFRETVHSLRKFVTL